MARGYYYRAGGCFRRGGIVGPKCYTSIRIGSRISSTTGRSYTAYKSLSSGGRVRTGSSCGRIRHSVRAVGRSYTAYKSTGYIGHINSSSSYGMTGHSTGTISRSTVGIVCAIFGLFALITLPIILSVSSGSSSNKYGLVCARCGSHDISSHHTYWYNNGLLCNGSEDYAKTHADYTIARCNNCGSDWKVYLKK